MAGRNSPGRNVSGPWTDPYYYDVGQQPMLDAGAQAWVASRASAQLRSVNMANCHLNDAAIESVFASDGLGRLKELDLSHNRFGVNGMTSMINSPRWQSLRSIELNDCGLGSDCDWPEIRAVSRDDFELLLSRGPYASWALTKLLR